MRLYSAARALEDVAGGPTPSSLLQEASKLDPDSVAIARRLSKIYIGALARPDLATPVRPKGPDDRAGRYRDAQPAGRLLLQAEKSDSAAAEALLKDVLANPKLDAHSPGRLVAEFELGKLYSTRLKQLDKAADAFAKVIDALDDKSANRLSPSDLARVLGNDPSTAYFNFGMVFLARQAGRAGGQGLRACA